MDVSGISGAAGFSGSSAAKIGAKTEGEGFGDLLGSLMNGLNSSTGQADAAIQGLALGDDVAIQDVVLATEMEALAFQFALQVRNRFVETVQTVMNMQV